MLRYHNVHIPIYHSLYIPPRHTVHRIISTHLYYYRIPLVYPFAVLGHPLSVPPLRLLLTS